MRMKRASYRHGIEHIALNDDPASLELRSVAATISVALLADLFGRDRFEVADDVIAYRRKHGDAPPDKKCRCYACGPGDQERDGTVECAVMESYEQ
jgi:hypothetical protein